MDTRLLSLLGHTSLPEHLLLTAVPQGSSRLRVTGVVPVQGAGALQIIHGSHRSFCQHLKQPEGHGTADWS